MVSAQALSLGAVMAYMVGVTWIAPVWAVGAVLCTLDALLHRGDS